jgi:SWI/SNF-related matrix-associated actin-dependent regulator 1 of chromatin subfamily A
MHLMIRRPKEEILKELPPKRRTLIPITLEDRDITQHYDKFLQILNAYITERNTIRNISDKEQQKILYEELRGKTANLISEFENLRQEAVYKKLPFAIQFIKNMLEQVNKVVVFAHHRKVIETVYEEFKDIAVVLYGETAEKERDKVVKRFQEDENVKLFIGSLRASAFGITLTASSNVVFLEFDWTPAVHLQAEDRCHRIGQKNAINIYYLALDNSIDIEMAKILEKKQTMIESLVDDIEKERISKLSIFDELLLLKGG